MDKNITLIAVSRFSKVARPYLGAINLVKMIESKQYATEVVLRAYHTEKTFLTELAEDITFLLALDTNLILSIRRYAMFLKLLQKQAQVEQHWPHLLNLAYFLDDCLPTSEAYRTQINAFVNQLTETDKLVCLEMVREFYPFWYQTYNVSDDALNVQNLQSLIPNNAGIDQSPLVSVWNQLEDQHLTNHEQLLVDHYMLGLEQVMHMHGAIDIRKKIAKFLLIQLRTFDGKTGANYRDAVDIVYSVVQSEDLKVFMFEVCREFYPFWMQEPEAIAKLQAIAEFKNATKVSS